MKKIIAFFLFLFILTGCGKGEAVPNYKNDGYSVKVTYHLGDGTWSGDNNHDVVFQYKPNSPIAQIGVDFKKGELPALANHKLEGWYTDESFTIPFDFETVRTVEGEEIHLYAKWVPNVSYAYQVIYFDENGNEVVLDKIATTAGGRFESILVKRTGYQVLGFFKDSDCLIPWDESFTMREANEGETDVIEKVYSVWIEKDYTIVKTPEEFTKAIERDKDIYLMNNLDFTGKEFTYATYGGKIIGNGYTISNITMNSLDVIGSEKFPKFGLFQSLFGADISDLTFENVNIIIETRVQIELYIGTLAGTITNSKLENVSYSGKIIVNEEQSKLSKLEINATAFAYEIDEETVFTNCTEPNVVVENNWKK